MININFSNKLEKTEISKTQTIRCAFSQKYKDKIIENNINACTTAMKRAFQQGKYSSDQDYATALHYYNQLKDLKLSKPNRKIYAQFERWLVGAEKKIQKHGCSEYKLNENTRFFKEGNTALLGASKEFCELNPDFVDFILQNDIAHWFHRVSPNKVFNSQDGKPLIPFGTIEMGDKKFQAGFKEEDFQTEELCWEDAKKKLINEKSLDKDTLALSGRQMTMWGLVSHHNFNWKVFKPITKVEAPAAPAVQVISYQDKKNKIPKVFGDQGHAGIIYVDKNGYVYSFGFFCPPPPEAYLMKALKSQRSMIRSPDPYESRHTASYEELANKLVDKNKTVPWNYGALQFNLDDDLEGAPCYERVMQIWDKFSKLETRDEAKETIKKLKADIDVLTAQDSYGKCKKLHVRVQKLYDTMLEYQPSLKNEKAMTGEEKFNLMLERVVDLQERTIEAREKHDWSNGAKPYNLKKQNCSTIALIHFGRWAQVYLNAKTNKYNQDAKNLDTRPNGKKFLPSIDSSKWEGALFSMKSLFLTWLGGLLSITPVFSTRVFGRGQASDNIQPQTSFLSCLKDFLLFRAPISPGEIRLKSMENQAPTNSIIRKLFKKIHSPARIIPQHSFTPQSL